VYAKGGEQQTALVLLNKGNQSADFTIDQLVSTGSWRDAETGDVIDVGEGDRVISTRVDPHEVKVLLLDGPVDHPELVERLTRTMDTLERCGLPRVEVEPEVLLAGEPVTVRFRGFRGKQVALHWGIDNWSGTGTPQAETPMTFDDQVLHHELNLTLPEAPGQFDFVFHNLTDDQWDNNSGQDWHFQVTSKLPGPPSNVSVQAQDAAVALQWFPVSGAAAYRVHFTDDGSEVSVGRGRRARHRQLRSDVPIGVRDRAVLLLLARLGLRAGDVASLNLSAIDWQAGTLLVAGKSETLLTVVTLRLQRSLYCAYCYPIVPNRHS
jgi:hypothetical protein